MKKNIAVVMGGFSGEHDISINSGTEVYKALNKGFFIVFSKIWKLRHKI